jgi:hypothetical protein
MGGKAQTSKGPRLFPEDRLRCRFYEPLVLLDVLDRNGQQRISRCPSEDQAAPQLQLRELRRTFVGQLAYVCDYIEGGDTVTAMALEMQPSSITFWVAPNIEPSAGTISSPRGILNTPQSLAFSGSENRGLSRRMRLPRGVLALTSKKLKRARPLCKRHCTSVWQV